MMKVNNYQKASNLVKEYPELQRFTGARDNRLIENAETILNCTFSETYRKFLLEFGAGSFGSFEIYGVTTEEFVNSCIPDVVFATLRERELGLPENLIVLSNDGAGYLSCTDCSKSVDDEHPIVGVDSIFPNESRSYEILYSDFASFFLNVVQSEILLANKLI